MFLWTRNDILYRWVSLKLGENNQFLVRVHTHKWLYHQRARSIYNSSITFHLSIRNSDIDLMWLTCLTKMLFTIIKTAIYLDKNRNTLYIVWYDSRHSKHSIDCPCTGPCYSQTPVCSLYFATVLSYVFLMILSHFFLKRCVSFWTYC
jgi:hypothetical protein